MGSKTVLITGCSSGIGYQTALYLAQKQYRVYAALKDLQSSEHLTDKAKQNDNLIPLQLDVTSESQIETALETIIREEKRLDILINNAGYGLFGPPEMCSIEQIKQLFEVNLFGAVALTHKSIARFRKQESGHIICISSLLAVKNLAILGAYSASKAALEAFCFAWAASLFPWNIDVSIIQPGATNTSFADNLTYGSVFSDRKNPYKAMLQKGQNFIKALNAPGSKAQKPE